MFWQLTVQVALFAIAIAVFSFLGYQWGVRREIVFLVSIVLGLLFLLADGGAYLAKLLYQYFLDTNLTEQQVTATHPRPVLVTTIFALAGIIILGYVIGRRWFPKAPIPQERILGIIPGVITGGLVAFYMTNYLFPTTQTSVITSGTIFLNLPFLITNFIGILFIIVLVGIIIVLAVTRPKKGGGGGGGGGGSHKHTIS